MSILVNTKLDFGNSRRIINLAQGAAAGEPVTYEQLNAVTEGLAWKDNVRAASVSNVNLAAPGSSIDGVVLSNGDRVLIKDQTTGTENGIYIFNGSATSMTRALDADSFDELESAVVTVDEGTDNVGSTWRQTAVNGVIGTDAINWITFGTSIPQATETVAGKAEIATQAETDAGVDDQRIVTPLKLKNFAGLIQKFSMTIGDGSATSISVVHNLGTEDVQTYIFEATGLKRNIVAEVQHTTSNSITLLFDSAPALNSLKVVVVG